MERQRLLASLCVSHIMYLHVMIVHVHHRISLCRCVYMRFLFRVLRVPTRPSPSKGFFSFYRVPTLSPFSSSSSFVVLSPGLSRHLAASAFRDTTTTSRRLPLQLCLVQRLSVHVHPGQHCCVGDGFMDSTAPLHVYRQRPFDIASLTRIPAAPLRG